MWYGKINKMPPDDNGDAFSWSCSACTYLHESSKERHFLKCSICGADKPTTTKSFACAEVSTEASRPVPPLVVSQRRSSISITRPSPGASLSTKGVQSTKKKKKRKIQLVLSPGLHNKDPSRKNTNFHGTNIGRSSSDYFIKKKTGGFQPHNNNKPRWFRPVCRLLAADSYQISTTSIGFLFRPDRSRSIE